MATNTYVALETQTLGSAVSSVTFSSIPQGYTDLVFVCNFTAGTTNFSTRVNGDTGGTYSYTRLYGTGSSVASTNSANDNVGITSNISNSSSNPTQMIVNFQNYSNTTTNKTALMRFGDASAIVFAVVGLWRNTAAINSLTVYSTSSQTIPAGSTFTIYGIANADTFAKATGGIISEDSTYTYHVFGSSGTFTPKQALTADILVVAGGGSGSSGQSGTYYGFGGGAGQVQYFAGQSLTATGYTCTVGAGGASIGNSNIGVNGNAGTASQFGALTAGTPGSGANYNSPGGSSGNGFTGGAGNPTATGGGAGAGANGSAAATSTTPGAGGNGLSTYSSWSLATSIGQLVSGTYWLAGGGGGVYQSTVAAGGYGGGGGGGTSITQAQRNGLANTGSGGSGGGDTAGNSGAGGSGVVIIRYPK